MFVVSTYDSVYILSIASDREDEVLDRPIFVIGVGRCGSSIFHSLLSNHSQLSWVSSHVDSHPTGFRMHRLLMDAVDAPVIGKLIRRRFHAREAYNFWDSHFRGFSTPCRDLGRNDVSEITKARVRDALAGLVTRRRPRLLVKITGWPRIGALVEMFPDAKFIHIIRDGHSVANSLLQVPWWWGWRGPQNWRFGLLNDADQAEWEKHQRSFVALAGIEWRMVMDATAKARQEVAPENILELRYEDLCADKSNVFNTVEKFCDIPHCEILSSVVSSTELRNTNDKWQKDLSPPQKEILQSVLKEARATYGYTES